MRTTLRTTVRLLGIASLALLLSGCLKATQDLTLNEDDTVDGTIVFAVNKDFLELAGITADDFLEQVTEGDGPVPGDVEFETEPYEDDEYIGSEFTFEGAPLSAFSDPAAGDLAIVREGDTFVVSGTLDASTEDLDPTGTPGADQLLESFDVRISITFPGEVEEASGEIDGTTVTWTPALGETTDISARGSAIGSGGGSGGGATLWIVLGAIAVLAVIVIAVVIGRKKPAPTEQVPPADGEIAAPPVEDAAPAAVTPPPPPAPVTEPVATPEPTAELPDMPGAPDTPDAPDGGSGSG